jgi:hypothetical protein
LFLGPPPGVPPMCIQSMLFTMTRDYTNKTLTWWPRWHSWWHSNIWWQPRRGSRWKSWWSTWRWSRRFAQLLFVICTYLIVSRYLPFGLWSPLSVCYSCPGFNTVVWDVISMKIMFFMLNLHQLVASKVQITNNSCANIVGLGCTNLN